MASKHRYDVFLSYDYEDEGAVGSFIDDLDSALKLYGIKTIKSLDLGPEVSISVIFEAIEQSKISIIVFSPNCAKSRWCETELLHIMNPQWKKVLPVFPVFFNVDQSDLVKPKGAFRQVLFEEVFERFKAIQNLRSSERIRLARQLGTFGKLLGWELTLKTARGAVIEDITHSVMWRLDNNLVAVGIYSHVEDVIQLCDRLDQVLILGITGVEGVGKTTLAKVIYKRIGHSFEYKSFLENVTEVSEQNGLDGLKNKLVSDLSNVEEIQSNKRALIVLDNVCKMREFEALCGRRDYFGHGSRIIITTPSKTLLDQVGADHIYTLKSMNNKKSLKLFSWHAFKQEIPAEGFVQLSRNAVEYCRGLPLSLKVLGSYFFGRNVDACTSALLKLKTIMRTHDFEIVLPTLKISYEGLSDMDKDIFLVIYQFFIGKDRDCVVLNGCAPDLETRLANLTERCLVSVDENNKLQMHVLVKYLAREILDEKTKPDWMNDVFLSFRGEDTRRSFTSHLYSALKNAGIKAFMDDRLERGADILSSLSSVIKESRISVVIFSTNYAGSRWCLEELEKIMECQRTKGQMVLPVFFNLDPSEVRKQTGIFGESFQGLLRRISTTQEKVSSWKSALTEAANLSGWDSKNYSTQVELIDNILRTIFVTVDDGTYLPIADHPVGVNSRVQDVIPLLSGGLNDVCIIGIWGMRGVGKTTLAKPFTMKLVAILMVRVSSQM